VGGLKRNVQIAVGAAVSLACLWLAFRGLALAEVGKALAGARYWLLAPALALYLAGVGVRAVRRRRLLLPVADVPSGRLFPIVVIGYMANDVLPARLGEVVRCYILRRREGVPTSTGLGTVLLERVLDGITMLAFMALALPLLPFSAALYRLLAGGAAVFGGAVVVLVLLAARPGLAARVAEATTRFLPAGPRERLGGVALSFFGGQAALGGAGATLRIFALSCAAWLIEAGVYYLLMFAFPMAPSLPLALLTVAVVSLGTVLPSSPGFVGVYDFLGRSVLGQFGVPAAEALAYVLVVHAALALPVTLLGFWYTRRLGGLSLLRPGAPAPPGATGETGAAGAAGAAPIPLVPALRGAV
jgi:uncharacterized membrane protein YbhN (UPF0104 family)